MAIKRRSTLGESPPIDFDSRRNRVDAQRLRRPKKQQTSDKTALAATEALLAHLATLMLAAGIDAPKFIDAVGRAFVVAAEEGSRLRNRRINMSAVAAMTGLPRPEVKRLIGLGAKRDSSKASVQRPSGVERVISGWKSDAEFLDSRRRPKRLGRGKGAGTFDSLVSRYGQDVPSAAVLRELKRRAAVRVSDSKIEMIRQEIRSGADLQVRRAAEFLTGLLRTISSQTAPPKIFARHEFTIRLSDELSTQLLKTHLDESIPIFFERARVAAEGRLRQRAIGKKENTRVSIQVFTISQKILK